MPQRRNRKPEPKVMTWGKASIPLAIAVAFDGLRIMFEWFIFFGPALAALGCIASVNSAIGSTGGNVVAGICAAAAGTAGFFGAVPIEAFGMIMAMAMGLAGWLTIGSIMLATNARIFRENLLWFVGSLALSEVPFLNTLPAFTITTWRMYHRQISSEKAAHAEWKKENEEITRQEQQETMLQMQQTQLAAAQEEQAAEEQQQAEQAEREEAEEVEQEQQETRATTPQGTPAAEQPSRQAASAQGATASGYSAEETQFETLQDPLSELNSKQNRTTEETRKLIRARQIMRNVSIDPTEAGDPVLRAAYGRADRGQKVSDGTEATRGGFVFNNLPEFRRTNPVTTAPRPSAEKSPEEFRKAA